MKRFKTTHFRILGMIVLFAGLTLTSCKNSSTSAIEEEDLASSAESMGVMMNSSTTTQINVFKSDGNVKTYDVILPAEPGFPHHGSGRWQDVVCKNDGSGSIGLDAGWNRAEGQTAFEVGTHQWESNSHYNWDAAWINAVNTMQSDETLDPNGNVGPEDGQNWTRYDMEIQGTADETYKLQLLADNCSWIYLDGQMVGYQDDSDVGGPIEYGVTTNGDLQTLTFIIWDGNGLAGGKFRMETTIEDIPEFEPPVSENSAPDADAGIDQIIEAEGPNTPVALEGSGSSDPDDDDLSYSWSIDGTEIATGVSPSVSLGLGTHVITLTVDDGNGGEDSDNVTVKVEDTTAPELSFSQETGSLWPPNHKMVLVATGISASDIVDGSTTVEVSVSSNEASNGKGDGNTDSDYDIVTNSDGSIDVYVRSERSGKGKGRTYTISMSTVDAAGNDASGSFEVQVAKSQGRGR